MAVDNDKAGKDFIQTMKCFVDLKEDIPTNEKRLERCPEETNE